MKEILGYIRVLFLVLGSLLSILLLGTDAYSQKGKGNFLTDFETELQAEFGSNYAVHKAGLPIITHYSPKIYKAHHQNYALAKSAKGLIYIGNEDGVLEFDGSTFALYSIGEQSPVYALEPSTRGKILVGSEGDFGYLMPDALGRMKYSSLKGKIPELDQEFGAVREIVQSETKSLFVTNNNLFACDTDSCHKINFPDQERWTLMDINGKLYIHRFRKGLYRFDERSARFVPQIFSPFFLENRIQCGASAGKNTYILITNTRKVYIVSESEKSIKYLCTIPISGKPTQLKRIAEDVWTVSLLGGGLVVFDREGHILDLIQPNEKSVLTNIEDILSDDENNIWITGEEGISHFEIQSNLRIWDEHSGLTGSVTNICSYRGEIISSSYRGAVRIKKNGIASRIDGIEGRINDVSPFYINDGKDSILICAGTYGIHTVEDSSSVNFTPLQVEVYSIKQSKKFPQYLFASSPRGLILVEFINNRFVSKGLIQGTHQKLGKVAIDTDDNIWVETAGNGVLRLLYQDSISTTSAITFSYNHSNGLPFLSRVVPLNLGEKHLFFGTPAGIFSFNDDDNTFIPAKGFSGALSDSSQDVYSATLAADGKLYFSPLNTLNGKLYQVFRDNEKFRLNETPFNRMPETLVHSLYADSAGVLWIGSTDGLIQVQTTKSVRRENPFSAFIRSIVVNRDSVIFGGTYIQHSKNGEIEVSEQQVASEIPTLDYSLNHLIFTFGSNSYIEPNKIQYSYYLEGHDDEWSPWTHQHFKEYTNLFEGSYTFYVKARDIYENESEIVIYRLKIRPPLFRHPIAYIIYAVLAGLVFWSLIQLNNKRLQRINAQLEKVISERTDEVLNANLILSKQKEEISEQADRLMALNTDITQKNEEITRRQLELEEAYDEIKALSQFGRQLTGELELNALITKAYEYIKLLMPSSCFGVGIYQKSKNRLDFHHFIEKGVYSPGGFDDLSNQKLLSVLCFSRNEEILVQKFSSSEYKEAYEYYKKANPNEDLESIVYLPLHSDTEKIGVLTVQDHQANSFERKHLAMLRTLGSYISIAIENSDAYSRIKEQNQKMTDSIRYAKTIQGAILPSNEQLRKLSSEHFILYKPKDIVSGDFYWYTRVGTRHYLALVDCTGHGVPGGFMSVIGDNLLTDRINRQKLSDPAEILERIHEGVILQLQQDQGYNDDGMSICLCVFEEQADGNYLLKFAGAHRPLYLYHSMEKRMQVIRGTHRYVGGYKKSEKRFETHTQTVRSGDLLYLLSDGLVDQRLNSGQKLGSKNFEEKIRSLTNDPMESQGIFWEQFLANNASLEEQRDDITLIGLKLK